jgi:UTP--glucose-1-phosphate uridylyltransferase
LNLFEAKMATQGLDEMVIETFKGYYRDVVDGATGIIGDDALQAPTKQEVVAVTTLGNYREEGRRRMSQAVRITLNGGLGTSMGLRGPKSLLPVREKLTFLEIIMRQAACGGIRQVFMNSFNTHAATMQALATIPHEMPPLTFIQNKFPKIRQDDLKPADCPQTPALEWNPPGHGDIYTAIKTSGVLDQLLAHGCRYALICNSDNLGATLDPVLLGFMAAKGIPFMMEVARRTPADAKGGHLAVRSDGGLILRESAQFPPGSDGGDITRYAYFNTNNLWVNLQDLKSLIAQHGTIKLPLIVNPKTLDPRDLDSPKVFQLESAMGAAIGLFEGARAVLVPRTRFFPVKKCNDLLIVRSDCFTLNDEYQLAVNPQRKSGDPLVSLDSRFYGQIDGFEARFPDGVPSLLACDELTVKGDIRFETPVVIRGRVTLTNPDGLQKVVPAGTVISADRTL